MGGLCTLLLWVRQKSGNTLTPLSMLCYNWPMSDGTDDIPVWERDGKFCGRCGELHYYSHQAYCKDCYAVVRREARELDMKRWLHRGGYTHVIRERYSGELFKYSLVDGGIPEKHVVVFVCGAGEILPRIYWGLKEYGE